MTTLRDITRWMQANVSDHLDDCGEVNMTSLVEAWDAECADGTVTLDHNHLAWEAAVIVHDWNTRRG